jgi:protein N-lysine methyltransferase METTL21A
VALANQSAKGASSKTEDAAAATADAALEIPEIPSMYITDQLPMFALMGHNIELNGLQRDVKALILNWGEPLPQEVRQQRPNVILAADCVYFEPAFPLLLATLEELLALADDVVIYFCFKKRRRADNQFVKKAQKKFCITEVVDEDRPVFSREGLFLYTFTRKHAKVPVTNGTTNGTANGTKASVKTQAK